jgi:spoIIIJ-associated protein
MNPAPAAQEILTIMLRHLGYTCEVTIEESADDSPPGLQVSVPDESAARSLIGRDGSRLEDIQHLVNKLLRQKLPDAPRIRIDINHFRGRKDDRFLDDVRKLADGVRTSGRAVKLEPMNSYQRRLVHNLFKDDPDIRTWAPEDQSRLKRITLLPRSAADPA